MTTNVGQIRKINRDVYEVQAGENIVLCTGRGVFRKRKIHPKVGDLVDYEEDGDNLALITHVHERKNELVRPPIANLDQVILVFSAVEPAFSVHLLDRFLAVIEAYHVEVLICLTKTDLASEEELTDIRKTLQYYEALGYTVLETNPTAPVSHEVMRPLIDGKISVLAGQSGVGKSTFLNSLFPELDLETAHISAALGRGKHTTRHVELIRIYDGWIADSPGFSSLDFQMIEKEELRFSFRDFHEVSDHCRFTSCLHLKEPKCAVKEAVEAGDIMQTRYDHYVQFMNEISERKPRY